VASHCVCLSIYSLLTLSSPQLSQNSQFSLSSQLSTLPSSLQLPSPLSPLPSPLSPLDSPQEKFQKSISAVHAHALSAYRGYLGVPSHPYRYASLKKTDKKCPRCKYVCMMIVMQAKPSLFQCKNIRVPEAVPRRYLCLVFTCCLVRMLRWKWLYKFLYPRCCNVGWSVL